MNKFKLQQRRFICWGSWPTNTCYQHP